MASRSGPRLASRSGSIIVRSSMVDPVNSWAAICPAAAEVCTPNPPKPTAQKKPSVVRSGPSTGLPQGCGHLLGTQGGAQAACSCAIDLYEVVAAISKRQRLLAQQLVLIGTGHDQRAAAMQQWPGRESLRRPLQERLGDACQPTRDVATVRLDELRGRPSTRVVAGLVLGLEQDNPGARRSEIRNRRADHAGTHDGEVEGRFAQDGTGCGCARTRPIVAGSALSRPGAAGAGSPLPVHRRSRASPRPGRRPSPRQRRRR